MEQELSPEQGTLLTEVKDYLGLGSSETSDTKHSINVGMSTLDTPAFKHRLSDVFKIKRECRGLYSDV